MDSSIVFGIVTKLEFVELGSPLLHPFEHRVKPVSLGVIQGYTSVLRNFIFSNYDILFDGLNNFVVVVRLLLGRHQTQPQYSKCLFICA
jgi:hypothetical protein